MFQLTLLQLVYGSTKAVLSNHNDHNIITNSQCTPLCAYDPTTETLRTIHCAVVDEYTG